MYITEDYVHRVCTGLQAAVQVHRDEFSFGMSPQRLREINDEIGSFFLEANWLVQYLNQWPEGRPHIGNDARIEGLS